MYVIKVQKQGVGTSGVHTLICTPEAHDLPTASFDGKIIECRGSATEMRCCNNVGVLIADRYGRMKAQEFKSQKYHSNHYSKWYNQNGAAEDPWVSIDDHEAAIPACLMLYGENSYVGDQTCSLEQNKGADVHIRKAA